MGTDHLGLKRDFEVLERIRSMHHRLPIGLGAHDDTNKWGGLGLSCHTDQRGDIRRACEARSEKTSRGKGRIRALGDEGPAYRLSCPVAAGR